MSEPTFWAIVLEIVVFVPLYLWGAHWTAKIRRQHGDRKFTSTSWDWLWPFTITYRFTDLAVYGWMKCTKCGHDLRLHVYSAENYLTMYRTTARYNSYREDNKCHGHVVLVRPNAEGYNYRQTGPCQCALDQHMIKLNQDKLEDSVPTIGSSKIHIGSEHDVGG